MAVLSTQTPVTPHGAYGPVSACMQITPSCKGGLPPLHAWLRQQRSDARGSVFLTGPDTKSRFILSYPSQYLFNLEAWRRLGVDFGVLQDETFVTMDGRADVAIQFLEAAHVPMIASSMMSDNTFTMFYGLTERIHYKTIDGVTIATITLWSDVWQGGTFGFFRHAVILPVVCKRARARGAQRIVVFISGSTSGADDPTIYSQYDIDVAVFTLFAGETIKTNGTTIYRTGPDYGLLSVSLVQDGAVWTDSFEAISLNTPPAGYDTAVFAADQAWAQLALDQANANNVALTVSTAALDPSTGPDGAYLCALYECHMGRMGCDAIYEWATWADVVVTVGGSFRGPGWPAGPVTNGDIYAGNPFTDLMCTQNYTGPGLLRILEQGLNFTASDGTKPEGASHSYLQVAGLRFRYNTLLPRQQRVTAVEVFDKELEEYVPLSRRRTYSVVTIQHLLRGADGYGDSLGDHQPGSQVCHTSTTIEVFIAYLKRQSTYTPHIDGLSINDFSGTWMNLLNKTREDCTVDERFLAEWSDCEPCEPGFWHPNVESEFCVEKLATVKESGDGAPIGLILGVVFGVLVLLAIPVAWKMTEKQRRINALFNNNKIAEECAVAVVELRLSDLDYLLELDNPNKIQAAFISIVKQLKVYMAFMPKTLLADRQGASEVIQKEASGAASDTSSNRSSRSSICSRDKENIRQATNFTQRKSISMMCLNSRNHTALCDKSDSAGVVHTALIENFTFTVATHKGVSEPMCGDRLVASWNTIVDRAGHCERACTAAHALVDRFTDPKKSVLPAWTAITPNIGIASGKVLFGLFGGTTTKKYDVIGKVLPSATILMLLNKEHETHILVTAKVAEAVNSLYFLRIVDHVKYRKLERASFIFELRERKESKNGDEWMYAMESHEKADPHAFCNETWYELVTNAKYPTQAEGLSEKLLSIVKSQNDNYVAPCASLDLL